MSESPSSARDRIIVALDVSTLGQACDIAYELRGLVGGFKVGLELLTAEGSRNVVKMIKDAGTRDFDDEKCRILYDAKFHDIPNTMAGAARAAAALGVWAFTVHASAGRAAIEVAVANKGESLVLAVTVLTSLSDSECRGIYGIDPPLMVTQLALMATRAGADGVVCSPKELEAIRSDELTATRNLMTVVPGVRPTWAAQDDQARVMTPGEAIKAGADYLVIGRPILRPPPEIGGRVEAVRRITEEIEEELS